MKCVIPGVNVKVFGKAIHCLSKIGDDIWFEPNEKALELRSINITRSAYGCFIFSPSFFQYFDPKYTVGTASVCSEDSNRCKVNSKSCVSVFKSLSTIDKTVDKCRILLDCKNCRLIFQLCCKHSIFKTFSLTYADCDPLRARVPKKECKNRLVSHSRLLSDIVVNFQSTLEEVTLSVNQEWVQLCNYVEDEPDPSKVVYSEFTLSGQEFDEFVIGVETKIVFSLKELKALLSFTDTVNMPVSLYFDAAGKPIVVTINSDPTFEVNLVLATVENDNTTVNNEQSSGTTTMATAIKVPQHETDASMTNLADESIRHDMEVSGLQDQGQNDSVPSSPPNKKLKTLILGTSQASYASERAPALGPDVLVGDSDEENCSD